MSPPLDAEPPTALQDDTRMAPETDGAIGSYRRVTRRRHDLLYVGTKFGGNVWVFDRTTLEPLGRLPTGVGGRRPYISRDGRFLYVTDQHYTYRYETDDLARYYQRDARVSPGQ
jgi:hypothetical protein